MFQIPRRDGISIAALQAEIAQVPLEKIPDNSGTARGENTREGWIKGLSMARLCGPDYPDKLHEYPVIDHCVNIFANQQKRGIVQVMVNELAPHSTLEIHRDGRPANFRWHLPVFTNSDVQWYDEIGGWEHMELGKWCGPVNYCHVLHSMTNDGEQRRIHLIVDLAMSVKGQELYERMHIVNSTDLVAVD